MVYLHITFLPPANEVWGKVIFSQSSVCPQEEGGVVMSLPVMDSTLPLQYGVRWKSGRYASYWNALFYLVSNLFIVISITDRMGRSPILMGLA